MKRKHVDGGDIDLDKELVILKDGSRLTEAKAEKLGREMSKRAARRRGRPSLTGRGQQSPHISARVTPQLRDQVDAIAKRDGRRSAEIVREALSEYVATHG
ncbi:MAG TPA: ribbon-helix-helix protein, CopG family [Nocardioidaceae bacterium]|nr:ribbon-helix-helix protein, CopG family [Nocardioidaceae bacterium]